MEALEVRNMEIRTKGKASKENTYRAIAAKHAIRDKETVRQWDLNGPDLMTESAMQFRDDAKIHNLLLGDRLSEDIAAGWVVFTDIILRGDTSPHTFRQFISSRFGLTEISPSWLTTFLARSHLSLKKVVHMASSEFQDDKRVGLIRYVRTVRSLHLSDCEVFAIDKTKFSQRSSSNVQITLKGTEYFLFLTPYIQSLNLSQCVVGVNQESETLIGQSIWKQSTRFSAQMGLLLPFILKRVARSQGKYYSLIRNSDTCIRNSKVKYDPGKVVCSAL